MFCPLLKAHLEVDNCLRVFNRGEVVSDEPLTIEDEIAYDACSNLILCMMKDADTTRRVAEIKAMPPAEAPNFDGERYKAQERTIIYGRGF